MIKQFPLLLLSCWLLVILAVRAVCDDAMSPSAESPSTLTVDETNAPPAQPEPAAEATAVQDRPPELHMGIDFSEVQDNSELRFEETDAYYALLQRAVQDPIAPLAAAAAEFIDRRKAVTHWPILKDMLDHPELYRAQPVTVSGHILNVVAYDAAENPYGFKELYEASLFTEDSQGHPMSIVFAERPENLPLGSDLIDGVEVTGYFFKVYYYPSADKHTRKAPLILARTVTVRAPITYRPVLPTWAVSLLAVLGIGLLVAITWWVQSRDQQFTKQRHQQELPQDLGKVATVDEPLTFEPPQLD
ncbi:MAG: hypothetical protein KDA58_12245 [Planctomycetaceae bacterium]|nr:hypothetical protein [Planctomycetaceae bacterium]